MEKGKDKLEIYCPKCKKLFTTEAEMLEHYSSKHEKNAPLKLTENSMKISSSNLKGKRKRRGVIVASILIAVLLVSWVGYTSYSLSTATPVEDYARSQHLPENIVAMLKPLDNDHQIDSNDKAVVDNLASIMSCAQSNSLS